MALFSRIGRFVERRFAVQFGWIKIEDRDAVTFDAGSASLRARRSRKALPMTAILQRFVRWVRAAAMRLGEGIKPYAVW